MQVYKLHVKIGNAEFDAEGTEETVTRQFEEFKALLSSHPVNQPSTVELVANASSARMDDAASPGKSLGIFGALYKAEERDGKNLMTLRMLPRDNKASFSFLLVLHAYKILGFDEVPVTTLKECLDRSGVRVARIDRGAAAMLEKENLVRRTGTRKASRYWLTNSGVTRAEELATQLLREAQ